MSPATAERSLFGDRVAHHVATRQSQLVLGLDPDPMRLWPRATELTEARRATEQARRATDLTEASAGANAALAERAARAVEAHCSLAIEAAGEQCVAVKLQVACFERLGVPGWAALTKAAARAREHGLLVIADAKRGDIDITATAYAQAFLGETPTAHGPVPGLGADAMTVNPLLGRDSLEPLVEIARGHARGLFVLVRTSNPGAADVQDLRVEDGSSVSDRLAAVVQSLGSAGVGESGLADVGAVVGATVRDRVGALREEMPHAIFLIPGVGAQGGTVEGLSEAFAPGPAGALVSVSRGIVAAHERTGGDPAASARDEAVRLRESLWSLSS